jgi:hypothetical protein
MNHTEAIENDKKNIKLVRLVYDDKNGKTWIEFTILINPDYTEQSEFWDNDNFIFGKFYKFLKRWKNDKIKKKDKEMFKDVWSILNDDIVIELIDMLDFAIEKGWYNQSKPVENPKKLNL